MINNKTRRTLLRLAALAFVVAISVQWSGAQNRLALLSSVLKWPNSAPATGGITSWRPTPIPTPKVVPTPTPPPTPTPGRVPIGPRASTVAVTNINDSGAGSLRQAIITANASVGAALPVTISFNIDSTAVIGGVATIRPLSALPALSTEIVLDGNTQTTFGGDTNGSGPEVVIDGTSAGAGVTGLTITGTQITVRGLTINNFSGDGIRITGTGSNFIRNCYIGLTPDGANDAGNGGDGIEVSAPSVGIGGVTGAGNVISGNAGNGVLFTGTTANTGSLGSNRIGTNANGDNEIPNDLNGVAFAAGANNNVVGNSSRAFNIISGNTGRGVSLSGTGTDSNIIASNYIGVGANGSDVVGNIGGGVLIQQGAAANTIGGNSTAFGNIISGNGGDGITLQDAATTSNNIYSNTFGLDAGLTAPIANTGNGILVNGANSTSIGGTNLGNNIRNSGLDGVRVQAGNGTQILSNIINDNTRLGINLVGGTEDIFGTTANDLGDGDTGANGLQNAPVITGVYRQASSFTEITGTLNSRPNTTYTIQYFRGAPADASGRGEAPTLINGTSTVTTNASGNATFGLNLAGAGTPSPGEFISATATDTTFTVGETSEFSNAFTALPTYEVDTIVDDGTLNACTGAAGDCSLRGAINNANGNVDKNAITFDITGGGIRTLTLNSALPTIVNPLVIDGYTNSGASVNTLATGNNASVLIRVDGGGIPVGGPTANGFDITAGNSTLRGLMVTNFTSAGIRLRSAGINSVIGCFVGTSGTADLGNPTGIAVDDINNVIGTSAAADRNVISGNQNGITINGTANKVSGNYIGTNAAGSGAIRNDFQGIFVLGDDNTIGGDNTGDGNVISGNGDNGITVQGVPGVVIKGNIIGLDATGATALGNTNRGIHVLTSNGATIGGVDATARNIISGNGTNGIQLDSGNNTVLGNYIGTDITGNVDRGNGNAGVLSAQDADVIGGDAANVISGNNGDGVIVTGSSTPGASRLQGNLIGTNAAGTGVLGNTGNGVTVDLAAANLLIGGTLPVQANIIANNGGAGISQDNSSTGSGNQYLGNSIYDNVGLGIDLGAPGVTPNDGNDVDAGPNNLQNSPEIGNILHAGGLTAVNCFINSAPNTQYRVELFRSPTRDASGSGEGKVFVEAQTITTDAAGNMTFGFAPAGTITDYFSVTATRIAAPTDTSEFSPSVRAPQNFTVDTTSDANLTACTAAANDCSLRGAIAAANLNAGVDTISFDIPGGGVRVISPTSALPAITEAVIIDGYTQAGSSVNTSATASNAVPLIQIDGAGAGAVDGLSITTGGGSTISGLIISNYFGGSGIIMTGGGNTITGCFIGTNGAGTAAAGNDVGISSNNSGDIIGGTTPAARNVISGNLTGVRALNSTNVFIRGNLIGTDKTGLAAIANGSFGVFVNGSSNITIGGNTAVARNVISGNGVGINIIGLASTNVTVQGNYIGTNVTGAAGLGNNSGITLNNFAANSGITIGSPVGTTAAAQIAANANVISFNTPGNGVSMGNGGNGVSVRGNSIYSNAALGLNIVGGAETQGITANDVNDADTGTNNIQNYPVINAATTAGGNTTISGTLNSVDSASYVIDLYRSPTANARGNGEGQTYVGSTTVTLPLSVNTGNFSLTVAGTFTGQFISGTATAADGSTSEFGVTRVVTAAAIPTVTTFTPATGRHGSIVTLTGTNFTGTTAVSFNGTNTSRFTVNSATQITATVPGAATTGPIAVTNPSGTGTSATNYTVSATDYDVTNTFDTGPGSLREAITTTNANAAAETVFFAIPGGGVQTIAPATVLPTITSAVTIDGYTQTGATANTLATGNNANILIQLDGVNIVGGSPVGVTVSASNSTVRGLAIGRFAGGGVTLTGTTTGSTVQGNFIGTDAAGTTARGNGPGVRIRGGSSSNTVGGTAAAARNVISGNTIGVQIDETNTTGNTVLNSYIGTNAAGTAAIANGTGVTLSVTGNTVGSTTANAGNLISGNTSRGISDVGSGVINATGNTIIGNTIGLNIGRTARLANQTGIVISSRDKTTVGSLGAGRNYIAGNTQEGITVFQNTAAAQGIVIQGNTVGLAGLGNGSDGIFMAGNGNSILSNTIQANTGNGITLSNATNILVQQNNIGSNTAGSGNTGSGVFLSNGAKNNSIGGTATDNNPQPEGNFIAGNAVGVNVNSAANDATGNSIRGNTIENNTGLGIDLRVLTEVANTPTLNDPGDPDTGNNNLQNYPVLTLVTGSTINGTLNSIANTTFALDFYDNTTADASGYGEGSTGLGQTTVTTNAAGNATFSFTPISAPAGVISATATNQTTGDTSEFSLTAAPSTGLVVDTTSDNNLTACTAAANDCSLRGAIARANANVGADIISFNIPGAGVQTIAPATDLPILTDSATTIDGSTQPGYAGRPVIVIAPTGANRTALEISSANNVIAALALNSNFVNLSISGTAATNNTIRVSHIGLNAAGTAPVAATIGVRIAGGAKNNRIGLAGAGNYIAGATDGVIITAAGTTGNSVAGNFIGVDGTGNTAAANVRGVSIESGAQNNVIGGAAAGTGNLISGNSSAGVTLSDTNTTGNTVSGNTIGLRANGTALGNGATGVGVTINASASANTIGGNTAAQRNVISGNTGGGVLIQGSAGNFVTGNYIGTNVAGSAAIPNLYGVGINSGSTGNTVGGNTAAVRNVISGNTSGGVSINGAGTNNNIISGNYVGTNPAGTAALPNEYGIGVFAGAKTNTIGGVTLAAGNLTSGNTNGGITLNDTGTTGNIVKGNFAGLNAAGTAALRNRFGIGVFAGASSNTIGGQALAERNVVSGNTESGISLNDNGTNSNIVQGNYVGTSADGNTAIGNGFGILLFNGTKSNTIGGTVAGAGNLASGNTAGGIYLTDTGTSNNLVQGNTVGLAANGARLGNGAFTPGITVISGANSNTIGGSVAARNIISGNDGAGVRIETSSGTIVASNYLGLNPAGNGVVRNSRGVAIENAANNTIGGTTVAARNFIAGNEFGVAIGGATSTGNQVQGNYIGTNTAGTAPSPNTFANDYGVGIANNAANNTIGGAATTTGAPPGNLISGSVNSNILLDAGAKGNFVYGNLLGTNAAGTAALGNFSTTSGISVAGASTGNTIGSATAGQRNVISGNAGHGVLIQNAGSSGNIVQANYIGVGLNGTTPIPNGGEGVAIVDGSNNTIGGVATGAGNTIRNNLKNGVSVAGGTVTGIEIRGNSIDNNTDLGIDLGHDGITANDDTARDADTGANGLQNFPRLTQTGANGTTFTYRADLITVPGAQLIIDLYSSPVADASGNGEGRTLQASSATIVADVTTGAATTTFVVPNSLAGQSLSATATAIASKSTSEFGPAVTATQTLTLSVAPAVFSESAGNGAATGTLTRSGPTTAALVVNLNSNDTGEATVPATATFAAGSATATFTVNAVNDAAVDGTQVVTLTATAGGFANGTATIQVLDDDGGGVLITPATTLATPILTTEAGGTATFTIRLTLAPAAGTTVTIPLSSNDLTEGTVSPANVQFNSANFATPQTVTVTGVNDLVDDDDVNFLIVTGPAASADPTYNNLNANDVFVRNTDDDTAAIFLSRRSGLITNESGATDTFRIHLNSQPTATVRINLTSSNTAEGTVSPAFVEFTAANYAADQTVTVTGVNDAVVDGSKTYQINLSKPVSADAKYSALAADFVLATNLDNDIAGTPGILAWGYNSFGQLGDGTTVHRSTPRIVTGFPAAADLAAGGGHSVTRTVTGTLAAAGYNAGGQLGDQTFIDKTTPVAVNGVSNVQSISTGWYHTLALRSDGTVWAWGNNTYGQLGNGTQTDSSSAVQVQYLSDVIAISAGVYHSSALKRDGTVWEWGNNFYGQLGNGTLNDSSVPVQARGITGATAISSGGAHTVALVGGNVWAWGWNDDGQLGNGNTIALATPARVSSISGVTAISAGYAHTLALVSGNLRAWGNNNYGQLGNGTTTGSLLPVNVIAVSNVTMISAGAAHNLAVRTDGTAWAWGNNAYGSLGDGTTVNVSTPFRIPGITNVTAISAGYAHCLARGETVAVIRTPPVTFSALTSRVSTGTVSLTFTGPLDATTAANAANYTVSIDGTKLTITDVTYRSADNTVVMKVNGLYTKGKVKVAWRGLLTANKGTVTDGEVSVISR